MSPSQFLNPFHDLELLESSKQGTLVAGVDEVGRGALFGPVVAAAVILPENARADLAILGVRDSKQLSAKRREKLAQEIRKVAIACHIGYAKAEEIDRLNIFQASLQAMQRAVIGLKPAPDICLVDGRFPLPDLPMPQKTIVKGDSCSLSIAAASIVAKVWRDDLIARFALKHPEYGLAANKGYATAQHRLALQQYGPTSQHRQSFAPCRV